jgi:hypothetical protein
MARYSYEEVRDYFSLQGCTLVSTDYKSSKAPLQYFCSCGNPKPSTITFDNFKNGGQRCKKCGKEKARVKKSYSIEQVKVIFEENGCILLSKEYVNNKTDLDFICSCGTPASRRLNDFYYSPHCPDCGIRERTSALRADIDDIREEFSKYNCTLISHDYENNTTPLEFICGCGKPDSKSIISFRETHKCRECAKEKLFEEQRLSLEYVKNYFKDYRCELLSTSYANNRTALDFRCYCGKLGSITFNSFKEGFRCGNHRLKGESHPRYNPDLTDEEREKARLIPGYDEWRTNIYERDKYTCQCCGDNTGGNLNPHHKDGYNWCVERRTDVTNGVTLCDTCHKDFHSEHGYGDNTEEQYNQWIRNKRKQDAV